MIAVNPTRVADTLNTTASATLDSICEAVASLVSQWLPENEHTAAHVTLGAEMLAARLYRRRATPSGVEALGELGAVYVARYDPDIAQLLGLGSHRRMVIA